MVYLDIADANFEVVEGIARATWTLFEDDLPPEYRPKTPFQKYVLAFTLRCTKPRMLQTFLFSAQLYGYEDEDSIETTIMEAERRLAPPRLEMNLEVQDIFPRDGGWGSATSLHRCLLQMLRQLKQVRVLAGSHLFAQLGNSYIDSRHHGPKR